MAESTLQWKREYEVLIGDSEKGNALSVKELRVKFEIIKTIGSVPNTCQLKIYNLNPDHEGQVRGEFDEVIVNAGYKGHSLLIFAGSIRHVFRYRDGNDWVMQVDAADGDSDLRNTIVNTSFAAGTSTSQLIDHMVSKFKKTTKGHVTVKERQRIRGRVLTGMAKDVFDTIANESDAHWSIQDGVLVMVPVASTLPDEAIVIRSDTGMLGAPEITDKGVKFKTLLNPQLRVNGKVMLDNNDLKARIAKERTEKPGAHHKPKAVKTLVRLDPDGVYKVYKLTHRGDTRGTEWESEGECVGLDKSIPAGKGAA